MTDKPNETKTETDYLFEAATLDDFDGVKKIVEEKNISASVTDNMGQTIAHVAAKNGNLKLVQYILDKEPTLLTQKDRNSSTILRLAVASKAMDLVNYLEGKYDPSSSKLSYHDFESAAMHAAIHYGHLDIVKHFLDEKKCDVNIRDEFEEPPVFTAVEERQNHIFKYLVEEKNANLTLLDRYGSNILFEFIRTDELSLMKYVLDEKKVPLDVNSRNVFNDTILHKAAHWNRLSIIEYLVGEKGAEVNVVGSHNTTPLHLAAYKDFYDVCKYLIEHGADTRLEDEKGFTPAKRTTNKELIEYINNATATRTRRSLYQRYPSSSQVIRQPADGSWWRNINAPLFPPPTAFIGGNTEDSQVNTYSTQIHHLLVLAEAVVKKVHDRGSHSLDSSSPASILQNKIDPIAVDAVNSIPYFEE